MIRNIGLPRPAANMRCELPGCREAFARRYWCGLRCATHAPSEALIRAHAIARAKQRRLLRRPRGES